MQVSHGLLQIQLSGEGGLHKDHRGAGGYDPEAEAEDKVYEGTMTTGVCLECKGSVCKCGLDKLHYHDEGGNVVLLCKWCEEVGKVAGVIEFSFGEPIKGKEETGV